MSKKWLWLTIVAVLLFGIVLLAGCGRSKTPLPVERPVPQEQATQEPVIEPPVIEQKAVEYEVMPGERGDKDLSHGEYHSENLDMAAAKRYQRDITVPRGAIDEQIAATLRRALDDFRDKHPDADALCVRVCFEESTAMTYANLYWAADGGKAFGSKSGTIDWHGNRPPKLEEGKRFGLSLKERKEVYTELVRAEDRAMNEAMTKYPDDVYKQIDMERELTPGYKKRVRQEYGITEEQQQKIEIEGLEQHWPMPEL